VKNLSYYSPGKFYSNLAFCSKEIDNFYTNILTGYKTISKQIILHDGKQITPLSVALKCAIGRQCVHNGVPIDCVLTIISVCENFTVHKFSQIIIYFKILDTKVVLQYLSFAI